MATPGQIDPIAEEHRALRASLARIEETTDLRLLLPLLEDLRELLAAHFAHEEAVDGLHEVIGDAAPHLLTAVQRLFDEHRECLELLDRLGERARECYEGPVREVLDQVGALAAKLHAHEAQETELLAGAVYEDVGESA